ncbi:hypothetical protein [Sulfurovum sp.]|uniref:hypothetical protein n=1 Tax=Sulfurovum sp. TaxID=1969726 RepID=UPI00286824D9|nr:hypothetical protein [Sulfurovum sp.]
MKNIIYILLIFHVTLMADKITPVKMKVDLMKNCEVLMLHAKKDKKSNTTHTFAGKGDCVMMYECLRNVSETDLAKMDANKRRIAKWENPVWCKVKVGHKEGWVEEQFLTDEPCVSDD